MPVAQLRFISSGGAAGAEASGPTGGIQHAEHRRAASGDRRRRGYRSSRRRPTVACAAPSAAAHSRPIASRSTSSSRRPEGRAGAIGEGCHRGGGGDRRRARASGRGHRRAARRPALACAERRVPRRDARPRVATVAAVAAATAATAAAAMAAATTTTPAAAATAAAVGRHWAAVSALHANVFAGGVGAPCLGANSSWPSRRRCAARAGRRTRRR